MVIRIFFLVCLKFETPPPLTRMDLKITRTSREQLIKIKCKGLQLASVVIPTKLSDDNKCHHSLSLCTELLVFLVFFNIGNHCFYGSVRG